MNINTINKQCICCKGLKPNKDFPLRSNSKTTTENTCRDCKNEARKKSVPLQDRLDQTCREHQSQKVLWAMANTKASND